MKCFNVQIGAKGTPRLCFEAMAASSVECFCQHFELAEIGERVEIECMSARLDECGQREQSSLRSAA